MAKQTGLDTVMGLFGGSKGLGDTITSSIKSKALGVVQGIGVKNIAAVVGIVGGAMSENTAVMAASIGALAGGKSALASIVMAGAGFAAGSAIDAEAAPDSGASEEVVLSPELQDQASTESTAQSSADAPAVSVENRYASSPSLAVSTDTASVDVSTPEP